MKKMRVAEVSSYVIDVQGYEELISAKALHQLHILIFFLAVFHVVYSFLTMMLGRLKVLKVFKL